MKNKSSGKRQSTGAGTMQRKRPPIDVSMTPDTFERSQSRIKKKAAKKRSSFIADETQMIGDETQLSQDDSMLDSTQTPLTLSQISAIDPEENETLSTSLTTKRKRRRPQTASDDTLELAVHYARGEPDGAEGNRSFTREQLAQMSLHDDSFDDAGKANHSYADVDMASDNGMSPSPAKRSKAMKEKENSPVKKEKKSILKLPFKEASKKLKSLKKTDKTKKSSKTEDVKFDRLPDETQVPETPKKTRKELKKEKKMARNNYELISLAKKSWEELRRHDLQPVKRKKICDELMKLTVGKVGELCRSHDSSRVIQCVVQYGNDQQRATVYEEIKDNIYKLCGDRYGKYVMRKLIHYGTKDLKNEIIKCFQGKVRKMIRHKDASDILEYAFNEFATESQRLAILEEFYGATFTLFKDRAHQSLDQIMKDQPEKKEMVIRGMSDALQPLVDKELLHHSLIHKVFFDFFTYADEISKRELIEGMRDSLPKMLHTRDGARVGMHCLWSGTKQDRKAIVKSFKGHITPLCKEEHGHLVVISVFDCVDDTKLVSKAILDEIVKNLYEIIHDKHGRKVLLYLLNPRDPAHFHPDIVKVLQQGDSNPQSKKDGAVRTAELRAHISPHLIKYLTENVELMMKNTSMVLLVKDIITHCTGDVAPAMRAIADFVAQPSSSATGALSMVEDPACHIALKKIIANDKVRMEAGEGILFSSILLECLPKSSIKVWAASNRGCFILYSLLQVGCSTVSERVKEHIQPVRKSLSKMTFKGAEMLLAKLDEGREYRV